MDSAFDLVINGLSQKKNLNNFSYHIILKYLFMISLIFIDEVCSFCVRCVWISLGSTQFIVKGFQDLNIGMILLGTFFYIYIQIDRSICEDKDSCKILDRPIIGKIKPNKFLMYMWVEKKTCMCGFDWNFHVCGIDE